MCQPARRIILDFFAIRIRLVTAGLLARVFVALALVLLTALAWLVALVLLTLVRVLARLALILIGILVHVRHLKNSFGVCYTTTLKPPAMLQCRSISAESKR